MDRSNNNNYVIDYANTKLREESPGAKPIMWFSRIHEDMRIKMLYRVINARPDHLIETVTFQPDSMYPIDIGKRRTGKPRVKWVDKAIEHAWRRL
eukprot:6452953-Karenia_brevis.AAC.1